MSFTQISYDRLRHKPFVSGMTVLDSTIDGLHNLLNQTTAILGANGSCLSLRKGMEGEAVNTVI